MSRVGAPGCRGANKSKLPDSVGFAIEDFSALRYIRDHSGDTDYDMDLDLPAYPDDPRDLFGMLQRAAP